MLSTLKFGHECARDCVFLVFHPFRTPYHFLQWILNLRGLLYYGEPFGPQPGLWSAMYLIGNPIVVWTCFGLIITYVLSVFVHLRYFFQAETAWSKSLSATHRACG